MSASGKGEKNTGKNLLSGTNTRENNIRPSRRGNSNVLEIIRVLTVLYSSTCKVEAGVTPTFGSG